jgi:hypothetical protein
VLLAVPLVAGCATRRTSYPLGAAVEFQVNCADNLWPGLRSAPLDLRQSFCACLLRDCEDRYSIEDFDRIRLALSRAGYRADAAGVPPEFLRMMAECRKSLDRGGLPVD